MRGDAGLDWIGKDRRKGQRGKGKMKKRVVQDQCEEIG
jgi:hypothetical protein